METRKRTSETWTPIWNQLKYFRVAARLQNITRSSVELGVSQPAVSRVLASLETALGVPLFERAGRSIRLTRYGIVLQQRVERALSEIEDACAELDDLLCPSRGTVPIGFLRSLGGHFVPRLVRSFGSVNPNIRFSFVQASIRTLLDELVDGRLDLGFIRGPVDHSAFESRVITEQRLVLIVSGTHRLAQASTVKLRDLSDDLFVTFQPGHRFRTIVNELCRQAGFVPKISFEGNDLTSVCGFVAEGFGVAIAPPECAHFPGVSCLQISEPIPRREVVVIWVRDRYLPTSSRLFRDFAVEGGPQNIDVPSFSGSSFLN